MRSREEKKRQVVKKGQSKTAFPLAVKLLLHHPGRAVHFKTPSACGEDPPSSVLTTDLQLVCSSKSLGGEDLKFKFLQFGCQAGSEKNLVAPSKEVQGQSLF